MWKLFDIFFAFRKEATHVRLGDFNYGSDRESHKPVTIRIDEVMLHPKYTKKSLYDNLALVRLHQSVEFGLHIRPACLPQMFDVAGETVSMTGWPFKLYNVPRSMRSKQDMTLRKYNMNPIDFEECKKIFAPHEIKGMSLGITDTQICASIIMEDDQRHFKILRPLEVNGNAHRITFNYNPINLILNTGTRWCSTSSDSKQRCLHVYYFGIVTFQTNIWINKSPTGIHPHLSIFIVDRTKCVVRIFNFVNYLILALFAQHF